MRIVHQRDPSYEAEIGRLVGRAEVARDLEPAVRSILDAVRERGDAAILEFTRRFDGVELTPETTRVAAQEMRAAASHVDETVRRAIDDAIVRIEAFHVREKPGSWEAIAADGLRYGQLFRPYDRVGIYVPGGAAAYPSTVLMNAIPARVAGVPEIVLATPPRPDGQVDASVLYAADRCGVRHVYRIGGAQAIAALAYGSETVPRVDKILGPGNVYVTLAKRLVCGDVGIDGIAGPSEVVVLAEEGSNPAFIAADLLSQAEHDPLATAVLVTPCPTLAAAVEEEIGRQLPSFERVEVISASLAEMGAIVVVEDLDSGIELVNRLAPEHVEVMVERADDVVSRLRNAGMILLGEISPVPFCDYGAGPTHVLPTGGAARYASPLGVNDCLKRTNYLSVARATYGALARSLETFAEAEGFSAHAAAIRVRREAFDE